MDKPQTTAKYRAYILFILVVVYTFNFIDRQIIGILKEPIKEELGLTDTQLGWLGGPAFAIFYTTLGVPIAWLADRTSRTWIMTGALSIWSAMTAVCGLAMSFWQLFLARVGVGVGEAGGVAPAYSLISDYFPEDKRARALSIYSFGIPIGSAIGIVLGGVLLDLIGWRYAFFIVGILGLLVAPIFLFTVREPLRGAFDAGGATTEKASFGDVMAVIAKKPSFWTLSLGGASSSMMGYGLIYWLPSYYYRSFGDALPGFFSWLPDFLVPNNPGPLLYASYFYGAILLFGGMLGVWAGGWAADKFGKKSKGAYAMIPAIAFVFTIPFFLLGVLSNSLLAVFLAFMVIQTLSLIWLGPIITAVQHLVPPNMRTTASAIFLMINNLIGIGVGTLLLGWLSDVMREQFGNESLRYALLSGTGFYAIAAALLFITARTLKKDWHR
ncbi:MFS transporter [Parvularcula sp. LCG005]|uniref:spinster family MFS transporter n=1 Tax=Parvularcula sp. LCG005 TaxID=3078805 RepID=UPI002942F492|nr:MFS transporter [Parvularcula sp. LCG005]WOI52156.1 MFS transporter [Parvularcula sp. LCG005]